MGLSLRGSTSGAIDINPPAVAGDNAITLPASNGSANQFFKNSGTAGIVTYSSMVENSGKIGIGTDNPTASLEIQSGANAPLIVGHSPNTEYLRIEPDGRVGIGTDDPNSLGRFTVVVPSTGGHGAINIQNHEKGSGKTNIVMRSLDNNGGNWAIAEHRAEGFSFKIATNERLNIASNGQISFRNAGSEYGFIKENGLGNVELGGTTELYLSTDGSERLRISPVGAFGLGGVNYGTSGQVLTSNGSGSAVGWSTVTSSLSFYFYGRQDTQHTITDGTYTRIKNLGSAAINQGDSSIATWNESVGTLTIGASGGGYWFLAGGSGVDDVSTGDYLQTVIGKNGTTTSLNAAISTYARSMSSASNFILESNVTTIAYLEPNDVVACYIYQTGTSASQPTEPNRCFFMGYRMMT